MVSFLGDGLLGSTCPLSMVQSNLWIRMFTHSGDLPISPSLIASQGGLDVSEIGRDGELKITNFLQVLQPPKIGISAPRYELVLDEIRLVILLMKYPIDRSCSCFYCGRKVGRLGYGQVSVCRLIQVELQLSVLVR